MSPKEQAHKVDKASIKRQPSKSSSEKLEIPAQKQTSDTIIQRARLDPHLLSSQDVAQLQRAVGNRAVNQLIGQDGSQGLSVQDQPITSTSLSSVIQRITYSGAEQIVKGLKENQTLSKQQAEEAVKDFLGGESEAQDYRDGFGEKITRERIKLMETRWGQDYAIDPTGIDLPSEKNVTEQIKTGTLKMTFRHEIAHFIRTKGEKGAPFQDVESFINSHQGDIERIHKDKIKIVAQPGAETQGWEGDQHVLTVPNAAQIETKRNRSIGIGGGEPPNWIEEIRADLKGIDLKYAKDGRVPSKLEVLKFGIVLGSGETHQGMDYGHPPAWFRVELMEEYCVNKRSGLCYLTTACVEARGLSDDCEELTALRHFRDTYLLKKPNGKELIELYYRYSPGIVEKIDQDPQKDGIYENIYRILRACVDAIKRDDMEYAYQTYCEMVVKLKEMFIPDERLPVYQI